MLPRIMAALAACALAGCSGMAPRGEEPVASTREETEAAILAAHISAIETVVRGSPAQQAEVLAGARTAWEQARQGPAALRYGLLLAAPAHPGRDVAQAQRLLREVAARPELLAGIERALALVELARVESELGLAGENARLVAEAQMQQEQERQRSSVPTATLQRRLQQEMDENARLKRELEVARAKLEAIATIEGRIPERPQPSEGRQP